MGRFCGVVGCSNRGERDKKSFFRLPAILRKGGKQRIELSQVRRRKWLLALRRADLTESKLKYMLICEDHFISGKPAMLEDPDNLDWVPSVKMGYVDSLKSSYKKKIYVDPDCVPSEEIGYHYSDKSSLVCKGITRSSNIESNDLVHDVCETHITLISSEKINFSNGTSTKPIILSVTPAKEPI